jgi:hypothetical protein
VLRGVVSGKMALRALGLEKFAEIFAGVFASAVRTESLDLRAVLSLSPGREVLVSLQGFILGLQQLNPSEVGVVVSESNVVLAASEGLKQ